MEEYFNKTLPKLIDDYEPRGQQLEMARLVDEAVRGPKQLIVEAGTGVGKTLAYLIPAVKFAVEENKRVFVCTYSKALQQQIHKKDLPLIKKIFPDLKYEVAFGSSNYACRRRTDDFKNSHNLFTKQAVFSDVIEFVKTGKGLRENAAFDIPDEIWSGINRDRETCLEESCEHFERCHYWRVRRRMFKSHLCVINHHLYLSDIMVGRKLLPDAHTVIFDEAHRLEDTARDLFSSGFSTSGYNSFLKELDEFIRKEAKYKKKEIKHLRGAVNAAKDDFKDFTSKLYTDPSLQLAKKGSALIEGRTGIEFSPEDTLKEVMGKVKEAAVEEPEEAKQKYFAYLLSMYDNYNNTVEEFLSRPSTERFYWVEKEGREGVKCSATPYDVAGMFRTSVLEAHESVILTSATLSIAGSFDYVTKRFGFDRVKTACLKSPFDYKKNALLCLDSTMPEPNSPEYAGELSHRIYEAIDAAGGGVLVLFTNIKLMKELHAEASRHIKHLPILRQGQMAPQELIEKFKETPSVLFATSTFWQGIDVKGERLKCVVITRLPFEMPEHPVQKALVERIQREGQDPFSTFSLPRAVFMLKQGFGRLIRSSTDRGAVIILDKRILSKNYGKSFLKSLPETEVAHSMDRVKEFFAATS